MIVIANVVGGGMRSITFVQAFQYWLKLTAIAVPALALLALFLADRAHAGRAAAADGDQRTTVAIETDVVVQVDAPAGITVTGTIDGRSMRDAPIASAGEHTLGAGTTLTLAAGAVTPVVAGAPEHGRGMDRFRRRARRCTPALPGAVHHRRDVPRHDGTSACAGALLHQPGRPGGAAHRAGGDRRCCRCFTYSRR